MIERAWSGETEHKLLLNYIHQLYSPIVQKLGWDPKRKCRTIVMHFSLHSFLFLPSSFAANEISLDSSLRALVLDMFSLTDDATLVAEAKKRFQEFQVSFFSFFLFEIFSDVYLFFFFFIENSAILVA
jgi:hypothetical protein